MKVSILALGAIVTTVSAGWILPEQRQQDRDPHRHYQPALPHSSHPPTHVQNGVAAAQSSPAQRSSCHGHGHHLPNKDLHNHPQSGLGVMISSLRTWLNEHNIMRYHPSMYHSPPPSSDKYRIELDNGLIMTSSGPTQMIDWSDPVFVDDDPNHPLSSPEILQKVLGMIDQKSAGTGFLVGMKSGSVTVVRVGDEGNVKTVYKPGFGLSPQEMGLQDRRGELVPIFRPKIKWHQDTELRITQLEAVDVSFTDDDPDHPIPSYLLGEKIRKLVLDKSLHGSIPTLKTGEIRAVLSGNGHDEIRKYRPIGSEEPDKVSDQAETDRMAIQGMKNWAKERNGGVETDVMMASTFGESRTIYNVDSGVISSMRSNGRSGGAEPGTAIMSHNGKPQIFDSRPPPPGSGQLYVPVEDMSVEILWRDAVFVGEDLQTVLSDRDVNVQMLEMIEEVGRKGGFLPRMKSGIVRVRFMAPRSTDIQIYRPGFGRSLGSEETRVKYREMREAGYRVEYQEDGSRAWTKDATDAEVGAEMWGQVGSEEVDGRPGRRPLDVGEREKEMLAVGYQAKYQEDGRKHWIRPMSAKGAAAVRKQMGWGDDVEIMTEAPEALVEENIRPHITEGHGDERPGGGLHGKGGWHHRRPQTFGGRLNRAMRNLRPSESLALAFVLGAGVGSILHMFFMITLLLTRRIRCGRLSKEERQARREERRARREGRVRLEGQDEAICILRNPIRDEEGRVPPEYEAAAAASAAKV